MSKLILTSKGFNTKIGQELISNILLTELTKAEIEKMCILLVDLPRYEVTEYLKMACLNLGFQEKNIFFSHGEVDQTRMMDVIYVTEGNTFDVLDHMRKNSLPTYIQNCMKSGAIYIGCSAGAMIAGTDIKLAQDFDDNNIHMHIFDGLCLFDGSILPHYEPIHLKNYIKNSDPDDICRYHKLYSVGDREALIMDTEKKTEHRVFWEKKK